jgi:hypothetical protein
MKYTSGRRADERIRTLQFADLMRVVVQTLVFVGFLKTTAKTPCLIAQPFGAPFRVPSVILAEDGLSLDSAADHSG